MHTALARLAPWLLVFIAAAPAHADGTYVKEGGGIVVPLDHPDIRLVREEIVMSVRRTHLLASDGEVEIAVSYVFHNDGDQPVTVKMGFPVDWDSSEGYAQGEDRYVRSAQSSMRAFAATVAGKRVAVARKPAKPRAILDRIRRALRSGDIAEHFQDDLVGCEEYEVWSARFPAHADVAVTNRYVADTSGGYYWNENRLVYTLHTGGAWKGPIERVAIRVFLGDRGCVHGGGPDRCTAEPEGAVGLASGPWEFVSDLARIAPAGVRETVAADGRLELTWVLENLEPTAADDVRLTYETATPARQKLRAIVARIAADRASPRPLVEEARRVLRGLYGYVDPDPTTQAAVAAASWYVPDPRMDLAAIGKTEPLLAQLDARLRTAP